MPQPEVTFGEDDLAPRRLTHAEGATPRVGSRPTLAPSSVCHEGTAPAGHRRQASHEAVDRGAALNGLLHSAPLCRLARPVDRFIKRKDSARSSHLAPAPGTTAIKARGPHLL
jgi:hypothetical protein